MSRFLISCEPAPGGHLSPGIAAGPGASSARGTRRRCDQSQEGGCAPGSPNPRLRFVRLPAPAWAGIRSRWPGNRRRPDHHGLLFSACARCARCDRNGMSASAGLRRPASSCGRVAGCAGGAARGQPRARGAPSGCSGRSRTRLLPPGVRLAGGCATGGRAVHGAAVRRRDRALPAAAARERNSGFIAGPGARGSSRQPGRRGDSTKREL